MTFTGFLLLSISILVPQMRAASSWIWHADDPPQKHPTTLAIFDTPLSCHHRFSPPSLKCPPTMPALPISTASRLGNVETSGAVITVSSQVESGLNVLAIRANNQGGLAGLVAELRVKTKEGLQSTFSTGSAWRSSEETQEAWMETSFDDAAWAEVAVIATLGDPPGEMSFRHQHAGQSPHCRPSLRLSDCSRLNAAKVRGSP